MVDSSILCVLYGPWNIFRTLRFSSIGLGYISGRSKANTVYIYIYICSVDVRLRGFDCTQRRRGFQNDPTSTVMTGGIELKNGNRTERVRTHDPSTAPVVDRTKTVARLSVGKKCTKFTSNNYERTQHLSSLLLHARLTHNTFPYSAHRVRRIALNTDRSPTCRTTRKRTPLTPGAALNVLKSTNEPFYFIQSPIVS